MSDCASHGTDCAACIADAACGFCADVESKCIATSEESSCGIIKGVSSWTVQGGECPAEFLNVSSSQWIWIGIAIGAVVLLIISLLLCCWCRKRRLRKFDQRQAENNARFGEREQARSIALQDKKLSKQEQHDAIRKKYNLDGASDSQSQPGESAHDV